MKNYTNRDTPETLNKIPISSSRLSPSIDVTPHGSVVSTSTSYASYTYSASAGLPAVYNHVTGTSLTFTGSIFGNNSPVIEWLWDFGDGNFATGQVVNHTYVFATLGLNCHLRTTNAEGQVGYASLNLMLVNP